MIDPRNGNLLTNEDKILDAALYTYTKRPENKGQSETYKGSKRKIMLEKTKNSKINKNTSLVNGRC